MMTSDAGRAAASGLLDEALVIQRELGDAHQQVNTLLRYGAHLYVAGDFDGAVAKCVEAVAVSRASGHRSGLSMALWNLSDVLIGQRVARVEEAAPLAAESLSIAPLTPLVTRRTPVLGRARSGRR